MYTKYATLLFNISVDRINLQYDNHNYGYIYMHYESMFLFPYFSGKSLLDFSD